MIEYRRTATVGNMTISELASAIPAEFEPRVYGLGSTIIESLSYDSRQVFGGVVFICLVGNKSDGHQFAMDAAAKGAAGFVIDQSHEAQFANIGRPYISVTNTRRALPYFAAHFYNDPSSALDLVGITGTNGKTTVSYMLSSIWQQAGGKAGVIGTIGAVVDSEPFPTNWSVSTTPESLDLQQFMAQLREELVKHVALEVTSIAIDQERTTALHFSTAIFTNLTQDHLDYHGSMDAYEAAKSRLFLSYESATKPGFLAVLNADDPAGRRLVASCRDRKIRTATYGVIDTFADFVASNIDAKANSTSFLTTEADGRSYTIEIPIGGMFNVSNALAAIAALRSRGVAIEAVQEGLRTMAPVPGRFEPVEVHGRGFHVLVDYAHTPDGLENVLKSAVALSPSRLIVVFGCGGDRDRTKRPKMGKIAADLADIVIITSDNPRKEDPVFIVNEIAAGISDGIDGERIRIIVDRKQAITEAVCNIARKGDLVVIAGKGHETYQEVGEKRYPFDDRKVVAEALKRCS